jgi:hypothetical protein
MSDRDTMTNDDDEKPDAEPKPALKSQTLIDAMQASPHRDIDIEPPRAPMPVRDVIL